MRNGRAQVHHGVWLALATVIPLLCSIPDPSIAAGAGDDAAAVPPSPRPKPGSDIVIETEGARLTARLAEAAPPLFGGLAWTIRRLPPAADSSGDSPPIVTSEARPALELAPGRYRAAAVVGPVEAETEFEVSRGEVTEVDLVFEAGGLDLTVVATAPDLALEDASIKIRRAGDGGGAPVVSASGGRVETVLPEGDYAVEADLGAISGATTVTVARGATTRAEVELEIGYIIADAVAAQGGEPLMGASFALTRADDTGGSDDPIARSAGRHAMFSVAPGDYHIAATFGLATAETAVGVAANRVTRTSITLNAARLDLEAIGPFPDLGAGAGARYRIFRAGADGGIEPLAEIEAASPELLLPAGEFTVEAERGGLLARETVTLAPGTAASLRLVLDAGFARVTAKARGGDLDGADIALSAIALAEDGSEIGPPFVLGSLSATPIALPAAQYRLVGELEPGGVRASTTIRLGSGADLEAALDFEVGNARLKVLTKPGGDPLADAYVILSGAHGSGVTRFRGGEVDVALAPGTYKVVAGSGTRSAEGELKVVAGDTTTIELVPN
jgi:hypothetical protein